MPKDIASALRFVSDRVVRPDLSVPATASTLKRVDVLGRPIKDARERTMLRLKKQAGLFTAIRGVAGNVLKFGLPGFTLGAGIAAAPGAVSPRQYNEEPQTAFQQFAPKQPEVE